MRPSRSTLVPPAAVLLGALALGWPCRSAPPDAQMVRTATVAAGELDPAAFGRVWPLEYDSWKKTAEPRPVGLSRYKRGFDTDKVIWDKLSEYPYMALLFNGWGFGVEYNEPRGHHYMVSDQLDVDPSRLKAGGVCLSCKSPYAPRLEQELGASYFSAPYREVHARIPEAARTLGVACADCHDPETMAPRITHPAAQRSMAALGLDLATAGRQSLRTLVCAQCHVTYVVPKDKDMHSTGLFYPWRGSREGDISVERIIEVIESDPANLEWTQAVTGFKLGFLRHPEYELFSRGSTHWAAGAACADCHMPYTRVGASKISDHDVMSPLKNGLRGCIQCHAETTDWLRERILFHQDRTLTQLLRSGYATAATARLFQLAHQAGKPLDPALHERAAGLYRQAFYRVVFVGAENSVGFHNPSEALRVLADATAFAAKAQAVLTEAMVRAGLPAPADPGLELALYLKDRGQKKLQLRPEQELKDPFGLQERLTPAAQQGRE